MSAKTQPIQSRKMPKGAREQAVLFGLIDLYIRTGKPVGSQTLQENGFESLSSATIRNYFGKLEELSFLKQPHTSGGRIPTEKAFRAYADHFSSRGTLGRSDSEKLEEGFSKTDRSGSENKIANVINSSAELLSRLSRCAVFISSPRFDQDFVQDVRLLLLDPMRLLAIVITDFGTVRTEIIYLEQEITQQFCLRCEVYFLWRLSKKEKQDPFESDAENKLAQRLYNEVMVRHVIGYLHFSTEEIVRCGVSRLLSLPEFSDPASVVNSLALLENETEMRALLRKCSQKGGLTAWIGNELSSHVASGVENSVLAIPYRINQTIVGSVALLGPVRLPYRELFGLLRHFSELLSEKLTSLVYKFKITYRHPLCDDREQIECNRILKTRGGSILLEDKRESI
jgi:heat-inducible transcriptional repressor